MLEYVADRREAIPDLEAEMLKALFFDLDGTIADTDAMHLASWIETLRPHGIDVDLDLYKEELSGGIGEETIRELLPDLSTREARELLENEAASYRSRTTKTGRYSAFASSWKRVASAG